MTKEAILQFGEIRRNGKSCPSFYEEMDSIRHVTSTSACNSISLKRGLPISERAKRALIYKLKIGIPIEMAKQIVEKEYGVKII